MANCTLYIYASLQSKATEKETYLHSSFTQTQTYSNNTNTSHLTFKTHQMIQVVETRPGFLSDPFP